MADKSENRAMAIGKKTGGRNFPKGMSGNPGGRPKLPKDVAEAKRVTNNEMILLFNKLMFITDAEIKAVLANPKTPKVERILARVLDKADIHGDHTRLEFLLTRTIGKVKDQVEVSLPVPTIIKRSDGSEIELGAKLANEEEDTK